MSGIRVWGRGTDLWVPRVPSILLLCGFFCNGYHGYQVWPVLGHGVTIYGYHGYQVYFFCVSVFVMGVPSMSCMDLWVPRVSSISCIVMWGSDLWVPRVPSILLLCGCFCNGYHGYQVCRVFVYGGAINAYHGYQVYFFCVGVFGMGTTGTEYGLYWGVG